MISDGWMLVSPLLLCALAYFLTAWSAAIFLTARMLNQRRRGLPALSGGRWLRWGWTLTLSGGWFLGCDLPRLTQRVDFFAVTDSETARTVMVVMAFIYAGLALFIGAALFLLGALEARSEQRLLTTQG